MPIINNVDDLLRSPSAEKLYLLRLSPYSLDASAVVNFYLSTGQYATEPDDTPASQVYIPVLEEIPSFNRSIDSTLSGQISLDLGNIVIPDDGRFNDWVKRDKYIWGGYEFELLLGAPTFAYEDFEAVIKGVMLDIEYTLDNGSRKINIRLGSKDVFLTQRLVQQNRFVGAPNTEIEGSVIPKCYGEVYNIQPVLYDANNLIYQVNDGQIEDLVMVYDRNVPLTLTGTAQAGASSSITLATSASATDDEYNGCEITITSGLGSGQTRTISDYVGTTRVATVSSAWTTTPNNTSVYSVKMFVKDNSNGRFTLIDQPTATANITCDVKGDKRGGTYRNTISAIVQEILTQSGGLVSGDLDSTSFSSFPNTAVVGWYFKDETRVIDATEVFLASAGASGGRDRDGKFQIIRLDAPSGLPDATLTNLDIFSITRDAFKPPASSVVIRYKHNFTKNNEVDVDDTAAGAERAAFVAEEWRKAVSSLSGASAAYLLAEEQKEQDSAFVLESDALAEANRRIGMFGKPSDIFRVVASSNPFKRQLGDIVRIDYNAYDLEGGDDMVLIGIDPEISEGTRITMTLWRNVG